MWVDIYAWQAIGVISQAFHVHPLLNIVTRADPDGAIPARVTLIDPVVAIRVDIVVITAKKDLLSLRYSEHRAAGGDFSAAGAPGG